MSVINDLGETCTFIEKSSIPSNWRNYQDTSFGFEQWNYYYMFVPCCGILLHADSGGGWFTPYNRYRGKLVIYNFDTEQWEDAYSYDRVGNDPDPRINLNCSYHSSNVYYSTVRSYPILAECSMYRYEGGDSNFKITITLGSLGDSTISNDDIQGKMMFGGNGSDFVWKQNTSNRSGAINHFADTLRGDMITSGLSHFLTTRRL